MKNIAFLICLLIVVSMPSAALAGNSVSIPLSCTIPLIPGVNAPPYEKEPLKAESTTAKTEATNTQEQIKTLLEENRPQTRIIAQEEKVTRLTKNKPTVLNLQTIYSR